MARIVELVTITNEPILINLDKVLFAFKNPEGVVRVALDGMLESVKTIELVEMAWESLKSLSVAPAAWQDMHR
jgi:hypothetical protein